MPVNHPTPADQTGVLQRRAIWILAALLLGVVLGAALGILHSSRRSTTPQNSPLPGRPAATWAPGAQPAPDFRLLDEHGAPVSLSDFRGKPVIVTFIDPVCTDLCPLEAKELNDAVAATPAASRPTIIAVSVNPWEDSRAIFLQDRKKWHLVPQWRWAAGRYAQLASVWKRYQIGVVATRKVIAGVTEHEVAHTEASYLVDSNGYERALFLFPFGGEDVAIELRQLAANPS
jgi:cytochrome oxidase Cu insertion factor (SCO1/SenC/PrrC family)